MKETLKAIFDIGDLEYIAGIRMRSDNRTQFIGDTVENSPSTMNIPHERILPATPKQDA